MTTRAKSKRRAVVTRPRGGASYPCTCKKKSATRVLDTRRPQGKDYVVRQRKCLSCGAMFTTREKKVRSLA